MAEPFIGFLIDKLCTYVDQSFISGFFGFEDEFEKMKISLPSLKSFFVDLQKPKNQDIRNSDLVKTNMVLLRELIYEADDILLDCQIHADCHKDSKPLITGINKVNFRHQTKRRLEEINGKISKMEDRLRTYCLPYMVHQGNSQEGSNSCATSSRWTTSLPNQFETVGLVEDVQRIKGWILPKKNELQRLAIVGMGGLGKTTLAEKVFNDKRVCARFKKRIWVSVSQPVNKVKIMRTILDELKVKDHSSDSIPATLLQQIKVALTETTYLIIMDDVWSLEDGWWSQILVGLAQDGKLNSCIIITTRNEEVARSMGVGELRIYRQKLLDEEDSWSLLCKVAFSSSKGICQKPELQSVGKNIAKKCGGLPLAVKAIAGLLSTKSQSLSEWQKTHEDFRDRLAEITASDGSVTASLQLSYDDLPSHLKQCMLCCSIYPEDFQIQTKQLVYWWAGEGFLVPGNNRKTTIQLAYEGLYELFSRCLIEPTNGSSKYLTDRLQECKMHDMVRELIITIAKQEAFSSFGDGNKQIFDNDTRHYGITEKKNSVQCTEVINSKIRAMVQTNICDGSLYRWKPDNTLPKVDTLRVLDLSRCDLRQVKDFGGWVKSQKRLAYLNLGSVSMLEEPTQFIKHLRNLQYLIIDCEYVKSVSSLRKLRLLQLCPRNAKYPEGLANLINLEELSGILLASPGNRADDCKLRELISLRNLRVLKLHIVGYICQDADVFECEMSVLSQLGDLQVLSINVGGCKNEEILKKLDQLVPPQSLQELHISQFLGETMPGFIKPELLPDLRSLFIEGAENLTDMSSYFWGENTRWNLETVSLNNLPKLQLKWGTVRQMMPIISFVEIRNVPQFKSFPGKTYKMKFSTWRKIEEEDSITREIAGSSKRKRKD